jgi:hypothetical protein
MKVRRIMAALALFTVTAFTDDCTILACAFLAART